MMMNRERIDGNLPPSGVYLFQLMAAVGKGAQSNVCQTLGSPHVNGP